MPDALFTRCPGCHTVFPLNAGQLAQAGGVVQCGGCQKVFNALAMLFDEWPSGEVRPARADGMPPVLPAPSQGRLELPEPELDELLQEISPGDSDQQPTIDLVARGATSATSYAWQRAGWRVAAVLLAVAVAVQILTMDAADRDWLFGEQQTGSPSRAHAVQVVARDLHRYPGLDDAIIISATLANQHDRPVPFPTLEVRLFDASQQIVGVRRLAPAEYLSDPALAEQLMEPRMPTPVILELVATTDDLQGFEFRFF